MDSIEQSVEQPQIQLPTDLLDQLVSLSTALKEVMQQRQSLLLRRQSLLQEQRSICEQQQILAEQQSTLRLQQAALLFRLPSTRAQK